jgi:hypothetical protein
LLSIAISFPEGLVQAYACTVASVASCEQARFSRTPLGQGQYSAENVSQTNTVLATRKRQHEIFCVEFGSQISSERYSRASQWVSREKLFAAYFSPFTHQVALEAHELK